MAVPKSTKHFKRLTSAIPAWSSRVESEEGLRYGPMFESNWRLYAANPAESRNWRIASRNPATWFQLGVLSLHSRELEKPIFLGHGGDGRGEGATDVLHETHG